MLVPVVIVLPVRPAEVTGGDGLRMLPVFLPALDQPPALARAVMFQLDGVAVQSARQQVRAQVSSAGAGGMCLLYLHGNSSPH